MRATKYIRPSIELAPLADEEMKLCLQLLQARLGTAREMTALVSTVEKFVFNDWPGLFADELALAFRDRKQPNIRKWNAARVNYRKQWRKNVRNELCEAQAEWRSRANGPDYIMIKKYNSFTTNFDVDALNSPEGFSLPKFVLATVAASRGGVRKPFLEVRIASISDLFRTFLVRAAANGQLSRFCHCVVCDRWELKERANRRSKAVTRFQGKNPDISKWPRFWLLLPTWPALCKRSECRTRFANVIRGRSLFREEDFLGLFPSAGLQSATVDEVETTRKE